MAAESFKIYSLQNDGTRIPAMVFAGQTSGEEDVPSSSVKEMTTAELTAMDIVARKAMYEDGIRLLRVYNDNTTVVLSLDANGKTSWAGGCQPRNLLDNSNFEIAQAGYNGMHGTQPYAADRWISSSNGNLTVTGEMKTYTSNEGYCFMLQKLWNDGRDKGKKYTFAIEMMDGTIYTCSGTVPAEDVTSQTVVAQVNLENSCSIIILKEANGEFAARLNAHLTGSTISFKYLSMYEGEYTAETLPPYVPKGYAAEMLECLRYFVIFRTNSEAGLIIGTGTMANTTTGRVAIPLSVAMRRTPTYVTYNIANNKADSCGKRQDASGFTVYSLASKMLTLQFTMPTAVTAYQPVTLQFSGYSGQFGFVGFSADL